MWKQICLLLFVLNLLIIGYCQENRYIVKKGDSAGKIAQDHGISLDSLKSWNNLTGSNPVISIDQELWIVNPNVIQEESQEMAKVEGNPIETMKETEDESNKETVNPSVGASSQQAGRHGKNALDTNIPEPNPEEAPSSSYSWVWLLLCLVVGLALGVLLVYMLYVRKLKAELEHKENDLLRVKSSLYDEKASANTEMARLRSKIQSLEREKSSLFDENVSLGEEMDRLRAAQSCARENRIEDATSKTTNQIANQTSGSQMTLFADAIIDDCFVKVRETPNEDSIFILHQNGENSAAFEVYESAYNRVVANPSFLEGCEKQVIGESLQLEIISKGMAQKDFSNGKWKVINKLNVIIR